MSTPERGPAGTWQYPAFWDNGVMALEATKRALPVDDHGAAWLIEGEHGSGWLRRGAISGDWHVWNGKASVPDVSGETDKIVSDLGFRLRVVIDTARQAVATAVHNRMPPGSGEAAEELARKQAWAEWKKAEAYAHRLATNAGKTALKGFLETTCNVSDDELAERQPGLLNLDTGTLNLATGAITPHNRADGITHVIPIRWNPQARCPRFWDLVWQVCGGDMAVAGYLLKLLGYSMLGDNREQKVIFLSGPSGSGKSVLLHCVAEVMGQLAHRSGADLICVVRHGRNARSENSIRGRRLITITETSKFMTIDEGQLKRITGEPVISVNQHYSKTELKTPVTWTIWVATNDMPNLVNFDAAMKRRIIVIPGGPGLDEAMMDPHLAAKILSTEREGILAMLAKGCAEYFRSGIRDMPDAVFLATEKYAAEQDTVGAFVADTMVIGGWGEGIGQHTAWEMYELWSRGGPRLPKTEFYSRMRAQTGILYNGASRRFEGVAWNQDWAVRIP
jgi:P4 family phage/plasmid primase-like protien